MTNKEIVDKIRLYESKWGRLGHTNIMKPELNHSGLEGGNKMSNMTNDLIAFRQKVAAGREANKLAHRSTINVTDINKRYFEDLTSSGTLIHAGSLSHSNLNYGQKFYNKIDNYYADGRARYFWSKAEWDAYQREQQGQAQDKFKKEQAQKKTAVSKEAERGNDMSGYEDWKKEKVVEKTKQINNNKQADAAKKIQDTYRQGGAKAAAQEVTKTNEWKELLNVFDEITKAGYDVRTLSNEDKKKLDPQLQKRMDKAKDDYTRLLGSNSKSRHEIHDELEKVMEEHVEKSISRRDKTSLNAATYGGNDMSGYENWKKEQEDKKKEEQVKDTYTKNRDASWVNEVVEVEKQGGTKAAVDKFIGSSADHNMKKVYRALIEKGLDPRTVSNSDLKKTLGKDYEEFKKIEEEYNSVINGYRNQMKDWGSFSDEIEKNHRDFVEEEIAEYKQRQQDDIYKKNKRAEKALNKEKQKKSEEIVNAYKEREQQRKDTYTKNKEADKYSQEDRWTDYNDKKELKETLTKFKKEMLPIADDKGVEAKKLLEKYIESGDRDDLAALEKVLTPEQKANLQSRLARLQKETFLGNTVRKDGSLREIKHSSEEPEVMDEYSAFMERVKRGKEKNRLAHSTLISPADLNARYEQAIKDKCFLVHGGNFKYYNKIDLGNGKSRYFYTKAEWDAYQDGLGQAKYEQQKQDAPKKAIAEQKNNMAGYADWKKQQDLNKQRQETYNKNKAADEAIAKKLQQNSTIIKKQLQEQYEKNKEASKHEGDRWAKSITEATKIADAPGKDAQNKPDNVQPPVKMEEEVKQEVQQSTTMPINEAYTNVLNNIWNDQTINDWAYICAVRSVYGPSEENEKAVWECQAYIDNTLAQIYNEIGTMYGEAAVAEIDGVIGANLQSMYQTYYNQVLNEFTMMANQQAMNNMMFP